MPRVFRLWLIFREYAVARKFMSLPGIALWRSLPKLSKRRLKQNMSLFANPFLANRCSTKMGVFTVHSCTSIMLYMYRHVHAAFLTVTLCYCRGKCNVNRIKSYSHKIYRIKVLLKWIIKYIIYTFLNLYDTISN